MGEIKTTETLYTISESSILFTGSFETQVKHWLLRTDWKKQF